MARFPLSGPRGFSWVSRASGVRIAVKEIPHMGKTLHISALLLMTTLAGCVFSISGSGTQPTKGQQLIDLKNARDRGAITQQEYDQQKTQILSRAQ
jgi:hypothetical protein